MIGKGGKKLWLFCGRVTVFQP